MLIVLSLSSVRLWEWGIFDFIGNQIEKECLAMTNANQ